MRGMLCVFLGMILFGGCNDTSSNESNRYKPSIDVSWHWQLQGELNTSYDVDLYDIDLFDTNTSTIQALHKKGKKVICYFSAGSWESWRADKERFSSEALGKPLQGWEGEKWLDITNESIYPVMLARLDLAVQKGCDGVEPDNMMGYKHDTGFTLSYADQIAYNKFIAQAAHKRGLAVGLKNDLDQIEELEPFFDFSLNESCHRYNECSKLLPFLDAHKPVLNAEYDKIYKEDSEKRAILCTRSKQLGLQTLILPRALDGSFRYDCNEF